jgi:hypothetical protein
MLCDRSHQVLSEGGVIHFRGDACRAVAAQAGLTNTYTWQQVRCIALTTYAAFATIASDLPGIHMMCT